MSTQNYSKEVVKSRMYRHAKDYWAVNIEISQHRIK